MLRIYYSETDMMKCSFALPRALLTLSLFFFSSLLAYDSTYEKEEFDAQAYRAGKYMPALRPIEVVGWLSLGTIVVVILQNSSTASAHHH